MEVSSEYLAKAIGIRIVRLKALFLNTSEGLVDSPAHVSLAHSTRGAWKTFPELVLLRARADRSQHRDDRVFERRQVPDHDFLDDLEIQAEIVMS